MRVSELPSGLAVVGDPPTPKPQAAGGTLTRFASRQLDTTGNDRDRKLATEGSKDWQREAWTYFDEVEEVKFAAGFRGSLMSRLILFAGFVVDPDSPPVPIADVPAGVLPAGFAEAAQAELSRLGSLDRVSALLDSWGSISTVSGESYLIGQEDDMADTGEQWRLFSESNLTRSPTGQGIAVRTEPGGPAEPLGEDSAQIRVWRPHKRWPTLADSNMRSVLATAEELLIYARQFRAVGKGRNSAGILYIADQIGDPPNSDGTPTKFEENLVASQAAAVIEDGAPAAAIPFIVRGPAAFGTGQRQIPAKDAIFHLPLDRKIDEKAVERISFLIQRLAHGLDVPVEVLTGIADINHWGAWQIEDSTYKAHIEPDALTFATAITAEILRPGLLDTFGEAALPLIRRVVTGLNPSALVVRPNRAQDAKDAFDANAISWEAFRRYLNFPDSDAPTAEELLIRLTLERSIGSATLTAPMLEATGLFPTVMEGLAEAADALNTDDGEDPAGDGAAPVDAPADQPTPDPDTQPDPAEAVGTGQQLSLLPPVAIEQQPSTHSANTQVPPVVPRGTFAATQTAAALGDRLSSIDRALIDRLLLSAAETSANAQRVLGQRLRASAQGDPEQAAAIQGIRNEDVAGTLLAAGFALPELAPLIEDQFDTIHQRWDTWTPAAFAQTAAVVAASTDDTDTADTAGGVLRDDEDQRTTRGWAVLAAALAAHIIAEATGQTGDAQGEADTLVRVPYGIARNAVAAAGGVATPGAQPLGLAGEIGHGATTGGIATGPQALRALRVTGYTVTGWTWHHGSPTSSFPPHSSLGGVTFGAWDDDLLINSVGWPPFSTYFPGDHKGCTCSTIPVFAPLTEG